MWLRSNAKSTSDFLLPDQSPSSTCLHVCSLQWVVMVHSFCHLSLVLLPTLSSWCSFCFHSYLLLNAMISLAFLSKNIQENSIWFAKSYFSAKCIVNTSLVTLRFDYIWALCPQFVYSSKGRSGRGCDPDSWKAFQPVEMVGGSGTLTGVYYVK